MLDSVNKILADAVTNNIFPGASLAICKNKKTIVTQAGTLNYDAASPAVNASTLYDCASITKSIPLALLAHQALEQGRLSLNTRLVDVLPDFSGRYHDQITIWHLLTYTVIWDFPNGMAALAKSDQDLVAALKTTSLIAPAGEKYYYTNAPAIVLGMVIEQISDQKLYQLACSRVLEPLGMYNSTFAPDSFYNVAPTERLEGVDLVSNVHDESARSLQSNGFNPANAGLFSTAEDVLLACQMILNNGDHDGTQFLQTPTIRTMLANQLKDRTERTGLGWEMDTTLFGSIGYRNPSIVGKTGHTGCCIVMNTKKQSAFVLLSNAIYPDRSTTREQRKTVGLDLAKTIF